MEVGVKKSRWVSREYGLGLLSHKKRDFHCGFKKDFWASKQNLGYKRIFNKQMYIKK